MKTLALPRRMSKTAAVAIGCLTIGAGAGAVASAGASSGSVPSPGSSSAAGSPTAATRGRQPLWNRAVHGDLVVATRSGFVHFTVDRGTVQGVAGEQLTVADGTRARTYTMVVLNVPGDARVRDNGSPASLSALTKGQRVTVIQSPGHMAVIARTPRTR